MSASSYNGLNSEEIDRICKNLVSTHQIGNLCNGHFSRSRLVALRKTELFNKLVTLYHGFFGAYLSSFKHFTNIPPGFCDRVLYVATCYISGWFWDLQVTIGRCMRKIPLSAFSDDFPDDIHHISDRYDPFLQHLNSIIRPTHIQMALANTLYIPVLAETLNLDDSGKPIGNVFNIPGFHIDECVTRSIISIMPQWEDPIPIEQLSTESHGRPGWLFDFCKGKAYSWFPMEHNYSSVDLIAPHILGIPLTPRLAPRDVDEWQIFPGGVLPTNIDPNDYKRISARNFFGYAEYTTLEYEKYNFPHDCSTIIVHVGSEQALSEPKTKALTKVTDSTAKQQPEPISVYRYRLIDWTYLHKVTRSVLREAIQDAIGEAFYSFVFKCGYSL